MTVKTKGTTMHAVAPIITTIVNWQKSFPDDEIPDVKGIIFSNEGAKGRKPLFNASDSQTGNIMGYWEDKAKGWLCISHPVQGYEVKAPEDMKSFFSGCILNSEGDTGPFISYLDVSHLNVSKTKNFCSCFFGFGRHVANSEILGLETWDVSKGTDFSMFFYEACSENKEIDLDLSKWHFKKCGVLNFDSFFYSFAGHAKKVTLNLNWEINCAGCFARMFCYFAINAKEVNILGIKNWHVSQVVWFSEMFKNFAPNSNYTLDLSAWKVQEKCGHTEFAQETFFKIKEPNWR